jgi:hypothetical protein
MLFINNYETGAVLNFGFMHGKSNNPMNTFSQKRITKLCNYSFIFVTSVAIYVEAFQEEQDLQLYYRSAYET